MGILYLFRGVCISGTTQFLKTWITWCDVDLPAAALNIASWPNYSDPSLKRVASIELGFTAIAVYKARYFFAFWPCLQFDSVPFKFSDNGSSGLRFYNCFSVQRCRFIYANIQRGLFSDLLVGLCTLISEAAKRQADTKAYCAYCEKCIFHSTLRIFVKVAIHYAS